MINPTVKVSFLGDSLKAIQAFPEEVRKLVGKQLRLVQWGKEPADWKPMTSVGPGVREIRVKHRGQWRVIYLVRSQEAVYVLHAFQKKTQKTAQRDLEKARQRLNAI